MTKQLVSTSAEWEVGKTYEFVYNIDKVSFAGLTLPDFLIPDAARQAAIEHSVTSALVKLASDPRLRVTGYVVNAQTFTVTAIATGHASPVEYVVYGIIAIFAIYGISLVLNQVSKVLSSGTAEIDLGGSSDTSGAHFKLPLVPLAIAGIAGLILFRK